MTTDPRRDARAEAQGVIGLGFAARVLEPSPPAVVDEWLADDPVAVDPLVPTLRPVPGGACSWDEWLESHNEHRTWAAQRWLGAFTRLNSPSSRFAESRHALHLLAAYVLAPARRRVNGKFGLRWTVGGFGTPFFGDDQQVRVDGDQLVVQFADNAVAEPITTLRRAAEFVLATAPDSEWAKQFDIPDAGDIDATLTVDPDAAAFLSSWYGFATSVLEELRTDERSVDASRVQLWPEHFDVAIELLAPSIRASYGASPGDEALPYPYLYVSVWNDMPPNAIWNATTFRGSILPLSQFVDAADQRATALEFFRNSRDALDARARRS